MNTSNIGFTDNDYINYTGVAACTIIIGCLLCRLVQCCTGKPKVKDNVNNSFTIEKQTTVHKREALAEEGNFKVINYIKEQMEINLQQVLNDEISDSKELEKILIQYIENFLTEDFEIGEYAMKAFNEIYIRDKITNHETTNALILPLTALLQQIGPVKTGLFLGETQLFILKSLHNLLKEVSIEDPATLNNLLTCLIETNTNTIDTGSQWIFFILNRLHKEEQVGFDSQTLKAEVEFLINQLNASSSSTASYRDNIANTLRRIFKQKSTKDLVTDLADKAAEAYKAYRSEVEKYRAEAEKSINYEGGNRFIKKSPK